MSGGGDLEDRLTWHPGEVEVEQQLGHGAAPAGKLAVEGWEKAHEGHTGEMAVAGCPLCQEELAATYSDLPPSG